MLYLTVLGLVQHRHPGSTHRADNTPQCKCQVSNEHQVRFFMHARAHTATAYACSFKYRPAYHEAFLGGARECCTARYSELENSRVQYIQYWRISHIRGTEEGAWREGCSSFIHAGGLSEC